MTEQPGVRTVPRRLARAALHGLPPRWRDAVQAGRAALTSAAIDPGPAIEFPPDVADAGALARMLSQTDLFLSPAEAANYLSDALERFRITMALVPSLDATNKVLELGSNPYFVTRLLRARGLDVTSANWFGEKSGFGASASQVVTESGTPHEYVFDHFNIESERFPYDDDSFDVVLFCEILEHLPADPTHALAEIHRVLRPGGTLILTTPNATRLSNLLRMQRGDNVYEELSGYGTYGRHNREYTVDELRRYLGACGYEIVRLFAADIGHAPDPPPPAPGVEPADRGENLFAVARPVGEPVWAYPEWLYSSRHALRRVVRPDVVIGLNCELQTSGLHDLETIGGRPGRWTGPSPAELLLAPATGAGELVVVGESTGQTAAGAVRVTVEFAGGTTTCDVPPDGRAFRLTLRSLAGAGEQPVRLWTDRTWSPAELAGDGTGDARRLGVVLRSVRFEHDESLPAGGGPVG